MLQQTIIPGVDASGAGCGRLIVPPSLGGALYAAYTLGTDFDPEPRRDQSGNGRHAALFGAGVDATGMDCGPANRLIVPFTGLDLMAGVGATLISIAKVAPTSRHALISNYAGANVQSLALYAYESDAMVIAAEADGANQGTNVYGIGAVDPDRGKSFYMYAATYTPINFGVGLGRNNSVGFYGGTLNKGPITGGAGFFCIGYNPVPNDPGIGRHAIDLFYRGALTQAQLTQVYSWAKAELAKSQVALS
ncbi:hypothetical protein BK022_03620 [Methylorubrum extorquens]|uniref:Uncharacterized protein n=1 Tax=Methylorubrum extorquens TaxID=408 RepID=A0A1S1P951_METEX|nr:hypothetical protein BK022_03620 [Methylorubrum extorquens]